MFIESDVHGPDRLNRTTTPFSPQESPPIFLSVRSDKPQCDQAARSRWQQCTQLLFN